MDHEFLSSNGEVVFEPIPNASQELAMDTRCDITLYWGTRGACKTAWQLMLYRKYVGVGFGRFWKGVIFDVEFKALADIIAQSKKLYELFDDGAQFYETPSLLKWVWPTKEELLFRHIKTAKDYTMNHHGHEYPYIGWNELTKWPTLKLFDTMMSTNRSSYLPKKKGDPEIPLIVTATCNPEGVGRNAVKKRFIDVAPSGEVVEKKTKVFNPKTQKVEDNIQTQVAIFGSYKENIYLDKKYVAQLESITDPNLRAAWLYGSWDKTSGGALDDLWNSEIHVLPKFKVPKEWYVDRSFDWGSTTPFSVGWWARANGEEVELPNGDIFCPERGSLIQISEIYGSASIGEDIGLKLSASEIAGMIKDYETRMLESGLIAKEPRPGPADNQIHDNNFEDVETIAEKMKQSCGIKWKKSVKSRGSRVIGLQVMRDMLESAITGEGPGIYFTRNCLATLEILPYLRRDEKQADDVDTNSEDHIWDMVRYRILDKSRIYSRNIKCRFLL